jgi:hypothetical protein
MANAVGEDFVLVGAELRHIYCQCIVGRSQMKSFPANFVVPQAGQVTGFEDFEVGIMVGRVHARAAFRKSSTASEQPLASAP